MDRFVEVGPEAGWACGEARTVSRGGRTIAVFRLEDGFFAIDDLCPHMGASLASGHLEGCVVTCPWHAWRFDVRDGTWCDNRRIRTDSFPVRIRGGMVQVEFPVSPGGENCPQSVPEDQAVPTSETMQPADDPAGGPGIGDFQQLIRRMYFEKDQARGVSGTFMWLMEEVGELATALRSDDRQNLAEEFADVLAWLATIANVAGVDLGAAVRQKYGAGCPGCGKFVCSCPDAEKP